jgi:hypothetical protein
LESINPLADTNNLSVGQAMFVPIQGTAPTMLPYDFRYMKVTYPSAISNPLEINILSNGTQLQIGKTITPNVFPLYGGISALIDANLNNGVYWENQSPPYEVIVDLGEVRSDVTSIELYFAYSHASATVEVSNDGIEYIACTGKGTSGNTQLFGTPYIAIPKEDEPVEPVDPVVGGVTDYVLPPPTVTILGISLPTISDEIGMNKTEITFKFDIDVTEYTVNVIGTSHLTGRIAHTGSAFNVIEMANMTVLELSQQTVKQVGAIVGGTEIVAEVDYTELYQEGMNRVNIYGKNTEGVWTTYNQESQLIEPPPEEPPPDTTILNNINFVGKVNGDNDTTRAVYYEDTQYSPLILPNVGYEIFDYENIANLDDGLVLTIFNQEVPIQLIFNFNVALIENIQSLTFQLNYKSFIPFYMKYWNFQINNWDDSTIVSNATEGFYEIKIDNVEPYINNDGNIYIILFSETKNNVTIDYANLVIERLE